MTDNPTNTEPTPENYTKRFRTKGMTAQLEAGCVARSRHRVYGWSNEGWQGRGAPRVRVP